MIRGFILLLVFTFSIFLGNAQVEMKIPTNYLEQTNAVKIDLFGLMRGYSQISYEKALSHNKGYEFSIGIIGVGLNHAFEYSDTVIGSKEHYKNQFGFFVSAGYKFNKLPLLEIGNKYSTHIFQGLYAKPIIYFGKYEENRIAIINFQQRRYELQRPSITFAALQIEFGKEWVIANKVVIDGYVGIGYCLDNKNYYSGSYYNFKTTSAFNYCNQRIGTSPGISTTIGIKTGLLFK